MILWDRCETYFPPSTSPSAAFSRKSWTLRLPFGASPTYSRTLTYKHKFVARNQYWMSNKRNESPNSHMQPNYRRTLQGIIPKTKRYTSEINLQIWYSTSIPCFWWKVARQQLDGSYSVRSDFCLKANTKEEESPLLDLSPILPFTRKKERIPL